MCVYLKPSQILSTALNGYELWSIGGVITVPPTQAIYKQVSKSDRSFPRDQKNGKKINLFENSIMSCEKEKKKEKEIIYQYPT